jgi:hypothetical protein
MRSLPLVALVLLPLGCAHPGPVGAPTLAGTLGNLRFDASSVTGPSVSLSRGADGNWRGVWACGPMGNLCSGEIVVRDDAIEVQGRRFGVSFTSRYAAVHEAYVDVLFRRSDGGPVPRALVVPLWLAHELAPGNARPVRPVPSTAEGRCVDVAGLGTVQLLVLPAGRTTHDVEVEDGCRFHFLERVAGSSPGRLLDLDPGP